METDIKEFKITIIVATRNRPDFLFRCLLSIHLQTLIEFECIVVGDNCNYSENVVREFQRIDKRFTYYKLVGDDIENVGAIGKNIGIKLSNSKYICYCDDDNVLLPNHLRILYNAISKNEFELVFTKALEIHFNDLSIFDILNRDLYYQAEDNKFETRKISRDALVMVHTKSLVNKIGYWRTCSEIGINEDGFFIDKIIRHVNEIANYKTYVTAIYYQHWNSITKGIKDSNEYKIKVKQLKNFNYVYPELIQNLKEKYMTLQDKTNWEIKDHIIEQYLNCCKEAITDEKVFSTFRSDERYTKILEHQSIQTATNYLNKIKESNPDLLKFAIKDNDLIGSPVLIDFDEEFKCSPSLLQYIGVLSNIVNNLGSIKDYKIIEIGAGFGSQCKIIQDAYDIKCYHIIDLDEVELLQDKYLKSFKKQYKVDFFNINSYEHHILPHYDLVISNYALSEIIEPAQSLYVRNVLLNSEHGYITCNEPICLIDLLKSKFASTIQITKDIEGEVESNYIITW